MVRDRIVFGIKNAKIRGKLINIGSELTLANALDTARAHEESHAQAKSMTDKDIPVNAIPETETNRGRIRDPNKITTTRLKVVAMVNRDKRRVVLYRKRRSCIPGVVTVIHTKHVQP